MHHSMVVQPWELSFPIMVLYAVFWENKIIYENVSETRKMGDLNISLGQGKKILTKTTAATKQE